MSVCPFKQTVVGGGNKPLSPILNSMTFSFFSQMTLKISWLKWWTAKRSQSPQFLLRRARRRRRSPEAARPRRASPTCRRTRHRRRSCKGRSSSPTLKPKFRPTFDNVTWTGKNINVINAKTNLYVDKFCVKGVFAHNFLCPSRSRCLSLSFSSLLVLLSITLPPSFRPFLEFVLTQNTALQNTSCSKKVRMPIHLQYFIWPQMIKGKERLIVSQWLKINKTAHIRHQCRKTAVLSCHRCLINTIVEKNYI